MHCPRRKHERNRLSLLKALSLEKKKGKKIYKGIKNASQANMTHPASLNLQEPASPRLVHTALHRYFCCICYKNVLLKISELWKICHFGIWKVRILLSFQNQKEIEFPGLSIAHLSITAYHFLRCSSFLCCFIISLCLCVAYMCLCVWHV